jgi:hypothetical protein
MTAIPLSASQLEKWLLCKRKWAWEYVDGIKPPSHPSADLGKRIHARLESWLAKGQVPPSFEKEGEIATKLIPKLPLPMAEGLSVEKGFSFELDGFLFRGFKDWELVSGDICVVGDHKTTSDLKWAKSEQVLLQDMQANIYMFESMSRLPDVKKFQANWNYVTTSSDPKVLSVDVEFDKEQVGSVITEVIEVANDLRTNLRRLKVAQDYSYNPTACGAFGGCPFQANCNLSDADHRKALFSQMAMAEEVKEKGMGIKELTQKLKMRDQQSVEPTGPSASLPTPSASAGVNPPVGGALGKFLKVAPAQVAPQAAPQSPQAVVDAMRAPANNLFNKFLTKPQEVKAPEPQATPPKLKPSHSLELEEVDNSLQKVLEKPPEAFTAAPFLAPTATEHSNLQLVIVALEGALNALKSLKG